jgi:hypothetical protein
MSLLQSPLQSPANMIEQGVRILLEQQNLDGGWGSVKGRVSNTESTAFAVLALESLTRKDLAQRIRAGLGWLTRHQQIDGSLPLNDLTPGGSWSTGVGLLCLSSFHEFRDRALRAASWALGQEGSHPGWLASLFISLAPDQETIKLNPDLKGWPWTAGSFSWVEPTSYFLIALKKLRGTLPPAKVEGRIRHADMMMFDRMCQGGGWNYGNSRVYAEDLWPYPDTTALALIALQDHPNTQATGKSIEVLKKDLIDVNSGLALSWSIICFALYGHETRGWKHMLAERFEKTGFLGEVKVIALAVLAFGDGINFFRLP